ncbi:fumarylacetoacetate hydrolase family protein [Sphaerotilus natans]|uniref:fumarylacetoacetate hydrolase family protein n=1 Tax=Sphaerotilus natans TaxID=34103 RepID=UPI00406D4575
MKLATYKDGSRDGQLVVVSSDLTTAHHASAIASRLQQVLDDWSFLSPQLHDLARTLDEGRARHAFPFDPRMCMAPLPRACRAVEVQLGDEPGGEDALAWQPLPGDGLLGACDEVTLAGPAATLAVAPRWIVLSGELPVGASPEQAQDSVRLVGAGLQWQQQDAACPRPWLSLAPVLMTPDALQAGERGEGRGRLALTLAPEGLPSPSAPAQPSPPIGPLLARLARARGLRAGTLLALGPAAQPLGEAERVVLAALAPRGQIPLGTLEVGLRRLRRD